MLQKNHKHVLKLSQACPKRYQTCPNCLTNMCQAFPNHVRRMSQQKILNMPCTLPKHVSNMFQACPRYVLEMARSYFKHVQTYPETVPKMSKKYPDHAPSVSKKYSEHVPKISPARSRTDLVPKMSQTIHLPTFLSLDEGFSLFRCKFGFSMAKRIYYRLDRSGGPEDRGSIGMLYITLPAKRITIKH